MFHLAICEILRVFNNTLTADEKYPLRNCENLPLPIRMQLSKKRKPFSYFFDTYWNLHQFLDILKKKMIVASNLLLEFKSGTDVVRQISKKPRFRTSFNSQDVKGLQKSVKSAWKHFYHIFSSHWGKLIWKMSLLVIFAMLGVFVTT